LPKRLFADVFLQAHVEAAEEIVPDVDAADALMASQYRSSFII
jgi:hypothetical protein